MFQLSIATGTQFCLCFSILKLWQVSVLFTFISAFYSYGVFQFCMYLSYIWNILSEPGRRVIHPERSADKVARGREPAGTESWHRETAIRTVHKDTERSTTASQSGRYRENQLEHKLNTGKQQFEQFTKTQKDLQLQVSQVGTVRTSSNIKLTPGNSSYTSSQWHREIYNCKSVR